VITIVTTTTNNENDDKISNALPVFLGVPILVRVPHGAGERVAGGNHGGVGKVGDASLVVGDGDKGGVLDVRLGVTPHWVRTWAHQQQL
jgi:hypothetical protein